MKSFILFSILISTNLYAEAFYCRSYNTGSIIVADTAKETLTFKDRFGNELDVLDHVMATSLTLNTIPATTQTTFMRGEEKIFVVSDQEGFIRGSTESDDSFLCFVRH